MLWKAMDFESIVSAIPPLRPREAEVKNLPLQDNYFILPLFEESTRGGNRFREKIFIELSSLPLLKTGGLVYTCFVGVFSFGTHTTFMEFFHGQKDTFARVGRVG